MATNQTLTEIYPPKPSQKEGYQSAACQIRWLCQIKSAGEGGLRFCNFTVIHEYGKLTALYHKA
jgi:hypothetical protein